MFLLFFSASQVDLTRRPNEFNQFNYTLVYKVKSLKQCYTSNYFHEYFI